MSDVEFFGGRFQVAERVGLMPLMRFAKVAKSGVDSDDMAGLAAMYDLLEQCIAPADWQRFQDAADKARADGEELMKVVQTAIELISARPTGRPSDSSDGPQITPQRSGSGRDSSAEESLRVVRELEAAGRPDKAQFVVMAMRERSAG